MTYCFFSAQYLPVGGGVERYTHNLAKELAARGEHAVVVTSARPGLPPSETDADGIEIFRVPGALLFHGRFPAAKPGPSLTRSLNGILLRSDRVVIQTRLYPLSLFAALRCSRLGKKFILIEHGSGHLNAGGTVRNFLGERYEHASASVLRRRVPAFYAVSSAGCAWLEHFGIHAKGILPNFIDPDAIEAATVGVDVFAVRKKYGLPEDRPLVLFTGRMVTEKGVTELAEAAPFLADMPRRPVMVFAGNGPLERSLPRSESVRVLGALPQREIFLLLKAADVFCLPSRSEGMPTSALEAAACGCYIVMTAVGGSTELIPGPEYGTLLPDAWPETVAAALREALEEPEGRKTAAEAARRRVYERFTVSSVCSALQAVPWDSL